jgi:L-threonylcarbamoyladenylate synthase
MARCLRVDASRPDVAVIEETVTVLRHGGVVAYPTDTVYGLAVDALNPEAVRRLYDVKRRSMTKAVSVIIGSPEQLSDLVLPPSPTAERLMAAFWPGPLTLVMVPYTHVPASLLGDTGRLGVRLPRLGLCQRLAQGLGRAITATSANRSGASVALSASEVMAQLDSTIDLVLDGGAVQSPEVSTVVDVAAEPPHLYRVGKIVPADIEAVLGYALIPAPECARRS